MKLPRGATGFGPPVADPNETLRTFTPIAYHAARVTHGTVAGITVAGVTPNFHAATIAYPDQQITILRHAQLPLLALGHQAPPDTTIAFVDHPALTAAIAQVSDLRVLTTAELNQSISPSDLTELHPHEQRQIHDWKPYTVGELLFNHWD